ncbi:caspase domain-containing protein [Actinomadura sp. LOL_016]|uniref:caspase family protein n=1 Tax=unclassified Actinomadura TaxID=2626254 RepID=UPI003A7FFD6B
MSDPWAPEGLSSRVLLIGVPDYQSPDLPAIPAVRHNLSALKKALSGERGLLLPSHCRVLGGNGDAIDQGLIGRELSLARREAEDLLLVYYAGHGLLDEDGLLHLALAGTEPENVGFTALSFNLVKRELAQARAKARVLLLDCCFSGRAVAAMSAPHNLLSGQLDLNGTYTLTSTTATAPSHAPPGAPYTAFTGALLNALHTPEALTLDGIYQHVDRELSSGGLPRPQARSVNAASNLVLARGPIRRSPPETPSPPPGPPEVRFSGKPDLTGRIVWRLISLILTVFAIWIGYVSWTRSEYGGLVVPAGTLPPAFFMVRMTYAKYMSLVIDGVGLTIERPGSHPSHVPWRDVSYVGILNNYAYDTRDKGIKTAQRVLIIRPWQHSDLSLKGTVVSSGFYWNRVARTLLTIGYVGCELGDVDADPVWLRQAVERLSDLEFRSDHELRDLDPRLNFPVGYY